MSDGRLFFKLHNGFPEHPKAIELSDKAFRQLVEAWCYCSRNLNDGKLSKAQFFKLFSAKSRKEMMTVGFVVESENGYEMHDYLDHQESAEQVEIRRNKRAEAGSKGGQAKAKGLANARQDAKQTASKPVADKDEDIDKEKADAFSPAGNVSELRTGRPTQIPANFAMTSAMQAWALRTIGSARAIDLELQTERFAANAREKAIQSASWPDSWRKWILKAVEFYDRDLAENGGPGLTKEQLKAKMSAPAMFRGKPLEEPA